MIYSNQTLGIDLGNSGVPLPTKRTGSQVGPSRFLNYPVLASAVRDEQQVPLSRARFTGTASQTFTIEFFSNKAADPSSCNQGQTYVGSTTVTTGNSGSANFRFVAAPNLGGQTSIGDSH